MGRALALGLAQSGAVEAADVCVSNPHTQKLEQLKAAVPEVNVITSNVECVREADVVVLAVKPWKLAEVVAEVAPAIDSRRQVVCSVAGGVGLTALQEMFAQAGANPLPPLYYLIPNTAIAQRQSMTFMCSAGSNRETDECLLAVFRQLGDAMLVEERLMNAGMVLASCGIANALRYVRAATEGGVQLGFRAADAQHIVAQTLRGAASLLDAEGAHAEAEIDKVTTPGGLTIRGLNAMEREGFSNAVVQGLLAAMPESERRG